MNFTLKSTDKNNEIRVGTHHREMTIVRIVNRLDESAQFSARVTVCLLSLALITALFIVWIFSEPIFQFFDDYSRNAKEKVERQKREGCISNNGIGRSANLVIVWTVTTMWLRTAQAQSLALPTNSASDEVLTMKASNTSIWQNGIGGGFKPGIQSISFDAGAGYGVEILGGRESHDLALASVSYGYTLGPIEGEGHWYRGNWEFRGELFSGAQFSPTDEWLVGLTPHLRYNFATGTRWIPFVDLGAGVSATGIGPPDLSHYFEFNLQAATGVRWFIKDNIALSIEARYFHMSCAGLSAPNLGLNNVNGMLGISWFF
jgi:lipid A 3-O-deacylase